MRSVYEERLAEANEIQGRISSGRDTIVPAPYWTVFARYIWPEKTAAHLAALTGRDERTAKRWLAGEFEPPHSVYAELFKKMGERPSG